MTSTFLLFHVLLLIHWPKASWKKFKKYEKLTKQYSYYTQNRALFYVYRKPRLYYTSAFLRHYQYLTNLRLLLYISFSKILSMFDYLVYILSTSVMILFFWNIIILPFLSWKADTFGEKFKIRHSSSKVFRIFEEKLLCPTDLCDLSYFLKWVLGD